jgi:hypothetical protein
METGHAARTSGMDKQHTYASWTSRIKHSVDMQHEDIENAAWTRTCSTETWTYSMDMDMQHGDIDMQHGNGHVPWRHGKAAWRHGHAAWICCTDMQLRQAVLTSCTDMQHEHAA